MRPIVFAVAAAILLCAGMARGEESQQTPLDPAEPPVRTPDFSDENLMQLFRPEDPRPAVERRVRWSFGGVEFRGLGTRWKIGYLPILWPLPGSVATTNRQMIDPFLLNQTEFAMTPRAFRRGRGINSEMRRIEKLDRERAKVVATPE